jgi:hypothetical protein
MIAEIRHPCEQHRQGDWRSSQGRPAAACPVFWI